MADVRLLYPPDKYEPALRLAEALAAAGYSVEKQPLAKDEAFPRLAPEAAKAKALLLIWSRSLVSAAMAGGLAEARRHPNLIEVSTDGIEPAGDGEASPVVLLCGWRGQPFHPGWQRILAHLERLCGARTLAPKDPRAGPAPSRAPASRRPLAGAAVAAGVLMAGTLGAVAAFDWSAPGSTPAREARPAAAREAPPAPAAVAPPPPVASAELAAAPAPPAPIVPVPAVPARAAPSQERTVGAAAPRKAPKRLASAFEPEVKRYSRKNSKTMRLFCQRSGRSTPQCRTFARSMRDLRG